MAKEKTKKVGFKKRFILFFLLAAPATVFILAGTVKCEHRFQRLDILGNIPAFTAHTLDGKAITNRNFKGKTVIYSTLQTTCPNKCGINFWFMDQHLFKEINGKLNKLTDVKIVSFVLDQDGNPATKKDLEDMQEIIKDNVVNYNPDIWMLVSGDPSEVYNIERNGENLKDIKGKEFIHGKAYNSTLMLADKMGHLRMIMRGDREGTVRTLKQDLELLIKEYQDDSKK